MTDKRHEDSAGKSGHPGNEEPGTKSGAGYGDHAEELQKSDTPAEGEEKSA